MKSQTIDNSYSLDNIDNYNKILVEDINEIMNKYVELIKEYLNFINDNIKIKNKQYIKFIVKRGLETITNVFLNILYYTKNLNLTYFHCQKSFYFYVEFIGQITEDQNVYLQLSSRDAATYVYRKTIFEINNECKKNIENPSNEISYKFDLINTYIDIYKSISLKIIDSLCNLYDNNFDNDNLILKQKKIQIVDQIHKINMKLKILSLNKDELNNFNSFINALDTKIDNNDLFQNILILYLKKINKNTNIILKLNQKIKNEEFYSYLNSNNNINENSDKFINYLVA